MESRILVPRQLAPEPVVMMSMYRWIWHDFTDMVHFDKVSIDSWESQGDAESHYLSKLPESERDKVKRSSEGGRSRLESEFFEANQNYSLCIVSEIWREPPPYNPWAKGPWEKVEIPDDTDMTGFLRYPFEERMAPRGQGDKRQWRDVVESFRKWVRLDD